MHWPSTETQLYKNSVEEVIKWIKTQKTGLSIGVSTWKGDNILVSSKDTANSFSVHY